MFPEARSLCRACKRYRPLKFFNPKQACCADCLSARRERLRNKRKLQQRLQAHQALGDGGDGGGAGGGGLGGGRGSDVVLNALSQVDDGSSARWQAVQKDVDEWRHTAQHGSQYPPHGPSLSPAHGDPPGMINNHPAAFRTVNNEVGG
jgi:hypothetical protein